MGFLQLQNMPFLSPSKQLLSNRNPSVLLRVMLSLDQLHPKGANTSENSRHATCYQYQIAPLFITME